MGTGISEQTTALMTKSVIKSELVSLATKIARTRHAIVVLHGDEVARIDGTLRAVYDEITRLQEEL